MVALLTLLASSTGLQAQEGNENPWKDSFYPYIGSTSLDFPTFILHFGYAKAANYYAPTFYAGQLTIDAAYSTRGTIGLLTAFRAPLLWPKWRLAAAAVAGRFVRFGYYGLGNTSVYDPAFVDDSSSTYYRVKRNRFLVNATLSRELLPHFFLAGTVGYEHSLLYDLPGASLFLTQQGNDISDDDAIGRLTLVYDTRDNDYNTTKGLFLEASAQAGSGGSGYSRFTAIARGYLPVLSRFVLAARVGGSSMSDGGPLNDKFQIPAWESYLEVLGGALSHRGLFYQRLAGQGVLFSNVDVRFTLLDFGDFGAVMLLGFFDAGRVFDESANETFRLTTQGMQLGGGGGIAGRILRNNVFTVNFGYGPDGLVVTYGVGWSF